MKKRVEEIKFKTMFPFLQAISIIVGIAYYLMKLSNQQRSQQQALEIKRTQSLSQFKSFLTTPDALRRWKILWPLDGSYEEGYEIYLNDAEYRDAFECVCGM
jgi:hypothetical protein